MSALVVGQRVRLVAGMCAGERGTIIEVYSVLGYSPVDCFHVLVDGRPNVMAYAASELEPLAETPTLVAVLGGAAVVRAVGT